MTEFLHEAAVLVARQHGAAQHLRSLHHPRPDGSCAGCGHRVRTRWPCVLIAIVELSVSFHVAERALVCCAKPGDPAVQEADRGSMNKLSP